MNEKKRAVKILQTVWADGRTYYAGLILEDPSPRVIQMVENKETVGFNQRVAVYLDETEIVEEKVEEPKEEKVSGNYYCTKCKHNHSANSGIGKKHLKYKK